MIAWSQSELSHLEEGPPNISGKWVGQPASLWVWVMCKGHEEAQTVVREDWLNPRPESLAR